MNRQSEFKKKYDPDAGKFVRKHIYGEGIRHKIRSLFGVKPIKKNLRSSPSPKPAPPPTSKKKVGDQIVKMLSQESKSRQSKKPMTQQQINDRTLQIIYGTGKKKLI